MIKAPESAAEELALLLDVLAAAGMEAFLLDMTPSDIRPFGITVVRALVFELMPISYASRFRYLGHRRLGDFAKWAGLDLDTDVDVNNLPQPFA